LVFLMLASDKRFTFSVLLGGLASMATAWGVFAALGSFRGNGSAPAERVSGRSLARVNPSGKSSKPIRAIT
jgi:hypothetical protein